jgi:hypothetical protein
MNINWKEAEFLMHCIELFANGDKEFPFTTYDGLDILLTTEQIEELFQQLQQQRQNAD